MAVDTARARKVVYIGVTSVLLVPLGCISLWLVCRLSIRLWHMTGGFRQGLGRFIESADAWLASPVSGLNIGELITILILVGLLTRVNPDKYRPQ